MRKLISRIRFLPLTIFAATLMLTVRVGDIWEEVDALMNGRTVQVAQAQAQTEPPQPAAEAPGAATSAPTGGETASAPSVGGGDGATTVQEDPTRLITDDPTLLSPAEIEVLMRLAERRDELEKRQREIDAREGLLRAAEIRIERRVKELEELQNVIEERIKVFDKQQEEKIASLVKIYENMKPKDAARIFEDLELTTLLDVAERMKERKLAPIMAQMNPERAREVTVELRELRQLPKNPGTPQ